MKNVTLTLEEEIAGWARIWPAQHEKSLSRMIGKILEHEMEEELTHELAKVIGASYLLA